VCIAIPGRVFQLRHTLPRSGPTVPRWKATTRKDERPNFGLGVTHSLCSTRTALTARYIAPVASDTSCASGSVVGIEYILPVSPR
jgi:hypothetical protein